MKSGDFYLKVKVQTSMTLGIKAFSLIGRSLTVYIRKKEVLAVFWLQ